jgi:sirohydrochlorin cobaltochelatase
MSALLIVGHGTRDAEGAARFRAFVRRVADRAAREGAADAVAGGFIELSPPPLKDAVAGLVAAGHRDLTAVPLILLAAGHAKGDIPAALARERERHPGLRTRLARPLGPHPVILDLLRRRLAAHAADAVGSTASGESARPDAVLLVGRGTSDPDANADLYRAARLLWETTRHTGVREVQPAFVSLAEPSVTEGLDRLRALGARRVVVLPFFLFPGVLPTRIHTQVRGWAAAHEGPDATRATVADVIGDCDALAGLVLERCREADGRGPAAPGMNCDACVYRIALPGFEDRVGRPQHPHDHPDDPAHPHHHTLEHGHAHENPHAHEIHHTPGHGLAHENHQTPEHGHEHGHPHPHAPADPPTALAAPGVRLAPHAPESPLSGSAGAPGADVG